MPGGGSPRLEAIRREGDLSNEEEEGWRRGSDPTPQCGDLELPRSHFSLGTSQTIAFQAPLSMVFPRQESWSGLPFPSTGNLPGPGIEPSSPALQVVFCIVDRLFTEAPGKPG